MSPFAYGAVLGICVVLGVAGISCGPSAPTPVAERRVWRGPDERVASRGVTVFDRREIAQKVNFPTCITAGSASFSVGQIDPLPSGDPVPPGLFDTGYGLDRWRLLAPAGALEDQRELFVTALGSTGILARYPRTTSC